MRSQYTVVVVSTVLLAAGLVGISPSFDFAPIAIAQEHQAHDDDHDHEKAEQATSREHAGHDHERAEADDHADHDHGKRTPSHDSHAGHADEEGGHEEESGAIRLNPDVLREFDIVVKTAESGSIQQTVRLPGEVVYNADRIANVTPSVAGITKRVNVSVGDHVKGGDVLAVLNSRELAAARSEFRAAKARLGLARGNLEAKQRLYRSRIALAEENAKRDRRLYEEKVGSERQVLESSQALEELRVESELATTEAKQAVAEAEIALEQAETSLHALGLSEEQLANIEGLKHGELNEYQLIAPLSGIVTQRNITIGEVVEPSGGEAPLIVADLSTVWVNLTVYQRDLAHVKAGQHVTIRFGHGIPNADGVITFVSPALEETTRTATARVVLENPDGHWRPGLFVEGEVETGQMSASVVVPFTAIAEMDGKQMIFVQTGEGFKPREVRVGRTTSRNVEIVNGLKPGERYVARNVLALKAEMNRGALEHAGHAH